MKTDLRRERSRRDIVRPAEGRKKVIERVIVRHIDGGQLQAHFVLVAMEMEQVVLADRDVEEVARRNARRIVVIVLGSYCRHFYKAGSELRCRARGRQRRRRRCTDAIAGESSLELLIGAQRVSEDICKRTAGCPFSVVDCGQSLFVFTP